MTKRKAPTAATGSEPVATLAVAGVEPVVEPAAAPVAPVDDASPSTAEYTVAFSPRQVAVGFAIVAGIIAVAVSRHRRRGGKPAGD
jgi:hypothetical protein